MQIVKKFSANEECFILLSIRKTLTFTFSCIFNISYYEIKVIPLDFQINYCFSSNDFINCLFKLISSSFFFSSSMLSSAFFFTRKYLSMAFKIVPLSSSSFHGFGTNLYICPSFMTSTTDAVSA
jgi:hypothetical protein